MGWTRFFRRSHWDAERAREIAAYIELETSDNITRGLTPEEALAAARRKFGNATHVRDEIYRMNSLGFLENLWRDVAYGVRNLRKSPGFTAVAVISLALGIGANTAIFSLVDTLMLRSLPVPHPEELVQIAEIRTDTVRPPSMGFSFAVFQAIREQTAVFSGVFSYFGLHDGTLVLDGQSERVIVEPVSSAFFETLGLHPIIGRTFTREQDRANPDLLAVISFAYWQRRFGGNPSVLGKSVRYNDAMFSIIGVGPRGFTGIGVESAVDLWIPVTAQLPPSWLEGPDIFQILGRVKPGVTPLAVAAAVNIIYPQMLEKQAAISSPKDKADIGTLPDYQRWRARQLVLLPGGRGVSGFHRRRYADPLVVLMTLVGLVLMIACANIANLSLARSTARRREMAVRLALGASRSRLLLQMFTESMLLALSGALAGLAFAAWAGPALVKMVIDRSEIAVQFHMDARVLAFTAAVTIATGLLFGIGPAMRATRVDPTPALKNDFVSIRTRFRLPVAKTLVVLQVALSLVLVLGAALFVATLQRLLHQDLGFRPERLLVVNLHLDPKGLVPIHRRLLDRVGTLPGVLSAALSDNAILGGGRYGMTAFPEGALDRRQRPNVQRVSPGFFETMQIPVVLGRALTDRDETSALKVAVVNEVLARRLFPNGPAVGKRFAWNQKAAADIEIVGVVKDVKWISLREDPSPFVYLAMAQPQAFPAQAFPGDEAMRDASLGIRVRGDVAPLAELIRKEVRALNGRVPEIRTQAALIDSHLKQERLLATLAGFFGLVGLLLAAVGLYGIMTYTVSRRTNEMGIRIALGAQPGDVVRMVLRETAMLVAAGIVAGAVAASAVTALIEKLLFGVTRTDPAMIALAAAILLAVGLLAAWLPAQRASRVSPMTALRHE